MADKNLFEFVKGILGPAQPPPVARKGGVRMSDIMQARGAKSADPDEQNPASIVRVGKTNDGRELIMTLGFGTFLVDRETPTICYFDRGAVSDVPTGDLISLHKSLMTKRNVDAFSMNYVDLLNVAAHELEFRNRAKKQGVPRPRPVPPPAVAKPKPAEPQFQIPDAENPATIVRVGKSREGAELVMTLGLGTFVVDREKMTIRYFDRGREWDVPDMEIQILIDSLMAKQEMKEHKYTYIDLLNVATFIQQSKRGPKFR